MIEKTITYYPENYDKKLSPNVLKIVETRKTFKQGSPVEEKPTNIIPFTPKPDAPLSPSNPDGWTKTAKKEDYYELLFRIYGNKIFELSEEELKELLQYTIDTGGFNGWFKKR